MERDISKEPMRGRTVFLVAAAAHFAITRIVSALTLSMVNSGSIHDPGTWHAQALGILSKVLYFPVISLALYPRGLFPGNSIFIPIAFNSLLWGFSVWIIWRFIPGRHGRTH